ncbi:hypothetical protein AKJ09_11356 [Labilithrix luteola]|uniref:Uncharacterized protein n=1 Tax=Labilithrix luteola TaxID=1391654 RepID=A0A0K1QG37_9BACT|nr:hypothetical protein [Labilithrix luteola]AKV04693.1 hypothetical protein AKJ09_11356 [Labilithrix luteola]
MRRVCAVCSLVPEQDDEESEETMSSQSWGITRERTADGSFTIVTRCPACWKKFVQAKQGSP